MPRKKRRALICLPAGEMTIFSEEICEMINWIEPFLDRDVFNEIVCVVASKPPGDRVKYLDDTLKWLDERL